MAFQLQPYTCWDSQHTPSPSPGHTTTNTFFFSNMSDLKTKQSNHRDCLSLTKISWWFRLCLLELLKDLEDVRHYQDFPHWTWDRPDCHSTLGKNFESARWTEVCGVSRLRKMSNLKPPGLPSSFQGQTEAIDIMILSLILTRSTKSICHGNH